MNILHRAAALAAVLSASLLLTSAPVAAAATFSVTTASLPNGVDGLAYSAQLASANGTGTVTWALASGSSLVKGLTLSSAGKISGIPTTSTNGAGSFKVTAKDSSKPAHTATATIAYIINPEAGAFRIITTQFPNGTVGINFTSSIKSSGGVGTVTYKLINNTALPAGLKLSTSGAITGSPTTATGKGFVVQATDSSTPAKKTVIAYLDILVHLGFSSSLPPGSAGAPYGGTMRVLGGAPTYTWTVNGSVASASANHVVLGDGLSAFECSGGNLCIGGTPEAAATVSFKASAKDTAGASSALDTWTIHISGAEQGSQVNGQIGNLDNWCGNGNVPSYPPITVTLGTTPARTVTADIHSGMFSFLDVPSGTYTITPSISIAGSSSVFYPASEKIAVSGGTVTAPSFTFSLGYTVSGTVNYSGTRTGRIYVALNGNNCGIQSGTSIASKGAFTIRGAAPGTYTLQAWMDNLGYGAPNASNPMGSSSVTVSTTANTSGVSITLSDPTPTTLTSAPQIQGMSAFSDGALAEYNAITDNNGEEIATSYNLEWSTEESFGSVAGSKTFPAIGTNNSSLWFVSGLTNGAAYYFRTQGMEGKSGGPWSSVYGPVTINAPSSGNTVSGTVSFTGTATGPLYTGFYSQKTGEVYATAIAHPVSAQAYSVKIPSGSDYYHFAFIDQNNDGTVDPGDIQNTNSGGHQSSVTISGPLANEDLTLPGGDSTATVTTAHYQQVSQGGSDSGYDLNFSVDGQIKQLAAVALISGPNVLSPVDIGECNNCGGSGFDFYVSLGNVAPKAGDTYGIQATYTDGTSQTLNASVSAVLSAFATGLSPTGTGSSITPTFKWSDPADASSYSYNFSLWDPNGNQIWHIPTHDSGNGFPSTITSITWGTDPTGANNPPSVNALTSGESYNWQIQVQDENGNSAQMQVSYEPN